MMKAFASWIFGALIGETAAEGVVEVLQPLRSAPLQHFLNWEAYLFTAEVQLHDVTSELRMRLLQAQDKVWAAASIPELRLQVNLSRWPDGQALLQQAIAPQSLQDIGVVLNMVQHLYNTFSNDFEDMKTNLNYLQREMDGQAHHFAVNLEIVLKQASVLLGLLRGLPNFSECLFQSLAEARDRRPSSGIYARAFLYLQSMAAGRPHDGTGLRVRLSTFAGEDFDPKGAFGEKLGALLLQSQEMMKILEASDLSQKVELDWCAGTKQLWEVNGPNPCKVLATGFERLSGWLLNWLVGGQPQRLLKKMRRRQFAAAPNISRVEVLSQLLHRSAEICLIEPSKKEKSMELQEILKAIADEEEINLEKEHDLLAESVANQYGPSEGLHSTDLRHLERPGLLGLVRNCLKAQWVFESGLLAVSTWADRVKRRGNALQNRLALVKANFEDLHDRLRALPSFRRLAFEEIHAAGHWGRKLSGGGSSAEITVPLANHLLQFLQTAPGQVESMIDIGCGWGEWIPAALQKGVGDGRLPESFRYLGVDIAWQPIKHLKEVHKNSFAPKLEFDVLDGVQDELPKGYQVALVRYVFQHLNLRDALNLLRNLRSAVDLVVLSSWPDSENEDLDNFGGSSAYAAMEPSSLGKFKSYDLRKEPFNLPAPLRHFCNPWLCRNFWWRCVEIQVFLSTRPLQGYQVVSESGLI
ncbi:unnamed protein product [Cladocopium goreaui]|uniref:Methyltransferase domain-containing protein n=1 Tax=Cladocopium goreaui TaxID=2562237 RepID=A0A9P1M428_9DINO|nr:unnamed protein product [Cladocopium goreaui]